MHHTPIARRASRPLSQRPLRLATTLVLCAGGALTVAGTVRADSPAAVAGRPLVPLRADVAASADAANYTNPALSVKSLKASYAAIRAKIEEAEREEKKREAAAGKGKKTDEEKITDEQSALLAMARRRARGSEEGEGKELGRMQALIQQLQMRAYPFDSLNATAYGRAYQQRAKMSAARSRRSSGGGGTVRRSSLAVKTNTASKWEFLGPKGIPPPYSIYFGPDDSLATGRVNALTVDPRNANIIYTGGAGGGVWKSVDGGNTWTVLSDGPAFPQVQVSSIAISPLNSNTLLVGLGDFNGQDLGGFGSGIMRTTDGGATWSNTGQPLAGASVSAIQYDPDNPSIVLATTGRGSAPGRIWRSTDGGISWAAAGGAPTGDWSAVTVSQKVNNQRAYYASAIGQGIWKSTDRGATWTKLNVPLLFNGPTTGALGLRVTASPTAPNTVYAIDANAEFLDGRIFRSMDGGASWADVTGSFPNGFGYDSLQQLNREPGYNWSQAWYDLHLTVGRLTTGPSPVDFVFGGGITIAGSPTGGVNFGDAGKVYEPDGAPNAHQTHSDQHTMAFLPGNGTRALIGNDGGVYGLTYNPATNTYDTLGGRLLNKTLGLTQFYHADFHPLANGTYVMLGGTQDNATPATSVELTGDLENWQNPGAGDGAGCAINPNNPNRQYLSSQNQFVSYTPWAFTPTVLPNNFFPVFGPPTLPVRSFDITPYTISNGNIQFWDGDPVPFIGVQEVSRRRVTGGNGSGWVFAGTDKLWAFNEAGFSPTVAFPDPNSAWIRRVGGTTLAGTGNFITAIATAYDNAPSPMPNFDSGPPSNSGVVYVGTSDGRVWMTINATLLNSSGTTDAKWVQINAPTGGQGLPNRSITGISVNSENPFDIVVSLSGTGAGHAWRCRNTFNAPSITWANISGNAGFDVLPDIPANSISRDPVKPDDVFYVGTDIGLFVSTDAGSSWQNATTPLGLPNAQVNVVKAIRPRLASGAFDPANGYLFAATYGRGMWRFPLNDLETAVPAVTPASLTARTGVARDSAGRLVFSLTLTNSGGATASNVRVTAASVTVGTQTTNAPGLPITVANVPGNSSITVPITFPATAAPRGALGNYSLSGTYAGGAAGATFSVSATRVRLP